MAAAASPCMYDTVYENDDSGHEILGPFRSVTISIGRKKMLIQAQFQNSST